MKNDYYIGLDLGGTSIKSGLCDANGIIVAEGQRSSEANRSAERVLENLAAAARELLETATRDGLKVRGIGVGTPGSVDIERGYLIGGTPNFSNWENVEIKAHLQTALGLPVFADNDANMMACGESNFGAGRDLKDIVCLTLGTGIGGGIIIGNKLFRGSKYAGTEIGHMTINYEGVACNCGGAGCWERYASATAMIALYNRLDPKRAVTGTLQIFERFHRQEVAAVQTVETEIECVAAGVANLVNIFNPEAVVIGGGVSEAGDWFIDSIAERVEKRAMKPSYAGVKIIAASLGNKAGWLGAAAAARDHS